MGQFMGYFTYKDDRISTLAACMYATGVVLMAALYNLTHHQFFFGSQIVGMRLRVAASSLIYRKVEKVLSTSPYLFNLYQILTIYIVVFFSITGPKTKQCFCCKMRNW